ncbi:MAG: hypothetical protein R3B36_35725 [Polyangiaceae bacterium]
MLSARRLAPLVTAFVFLAAPRAAHADDAQDAAACNPAYEEADVLLRAGGTKLLDAKEKLLVCASPACKPWMVKECTKLLSELEARLPSVVFDAKDADGQPIVDATVSSGERALAERLDGRAIVVGPGERTFVFTTPDGRRTTVTAIVREGEKAQRVTAVFGPSEAPAAPPPPPPPPAPPAENVAPPPPVDSPAPERAQRDLRTVGYVVGGAGIVGLAVGGIFGLVAIGAKNEAQCNERNQCQPGPLADARSAATVSTVGFVAGAALLAAGVTLVLVSPSKTSSASITARPMFSSSGSGAMLGATW